MQLSGLYPQWVILRPYCLELGVVPAQTWMGMSGVDPMTNAGAGGTRLPVQSGQKMLEVAVARGAEISKPLL